MRDYKLGLIIPARYKSTRLPGKPLIDLRGKTMIQRTWEKCISVVPEHSVHVATDCKKIKDHVESFGGQVVMTSEHCNTGTDRVAEANEVLKYDLVINVQGDEPLISPADIQKVIDFSQEAGDQVVNAFAPVRSEEEYRSKTIPKVVKSLKNDLLYMSRATIPGNKSGQFEVAYKQICIYSFPKDALIKFSSRKEKTQFEDVEDIEILRFLELGMPVKLVEVEGNSIAVDVQRDVDKVLERIR